ncbi:HTH_Tnp_Tc3_2 domain-containing protein [Trichonephila clavipes]|uniref:HTH_Tnp_Tc3_2 domain-containing protein n=1 Tax=Trichonephila clavipes TaxID=2585209 RepID=A0A8X6W4B3_TRICX|nr:HTH_Tnp_Tc3_2 domain-containing protein [Trichonephila clavipes]
MPVKHNVCLLNLPDVEEVPSYDGEIVLSGLPEPPISLNDIGPILHPQQQTTRRYSPLVSMKKRNKYRCGQRTVRWQRGLNRSTAHARVPSQSQSVFTSRREQSILWAPPVSAVWIFGDGDFLSTREAKILCAPSSTASDLSRQLSSATGTTVSRQTVYRRLGHIGLYARRPVRCVPLTATHCRLRLTWSREHALWTPQQWPCVMFSDESRFSLQSDSRRTLIWRAPDTRYHQENTIERQPYGGAGWHVCGGIILVVPELTCMFRV